MLINLAKENEGVAGKFKIAAGVVHKRHLVATGINSYKSHPMMMGKGYREEQIYLHAEVDAIKNALKLITQEELRKSTLYVVRVKKDRQGVYKEGLAKPCKGCQNWINTFGIKEVLWTLDQ